MNILLKARKLVPCRVQEEAYFIEKLRTIFEQHFPIVRIQAVNGSPPANRRMILVQGEYSLREGERSLACPTFFLDELIHDEFYGEGIEKKALFWIADLRKVKDLSDYKKIMRGEL